MVILNSWDWPIKVAEGKWRIATAVESLSKPRKYMSDTGRPIDWAAKDPTAMEVLTSRTTTPLKKISAGWGAVGSGG